MAWNCLSWCSIITQKKNFHVVVRVKCEATSSDKTELLHFSLSSLDLLAVIITPSKQID